MKTSYVFVLRWCFQDVLIKTNILTLVIHLQKTSSRCLDQEEYIRLGDKSSRNLQDAFRTSFQNVFKVSCKNFLKTSSRLVEKMSPKHFQDVFKTYHQVRIQGVFETYYKDSYLQKDFPESHVWEIYGQGTKCSRMNSLDIPKLLKQFFKTLYEMTRYYCWSRVSAKMSLSL